MHHVKHVWAPALALVIAALALPSQAQQQAEPIATMPVRDNIYLVTGGAGSNSSFIVGDKGVIVVDAKMTEDSGKGVVAEIAKATPKPVTTVILTHSDADHVNGLVGFPMGLTIIAQENCKAEMEKSLSNPQMPAPRDYMPTKWIEPLN
jgi:cyclase